jgi:transposase, IS5 family
VQQLVITLRVYFLQQWFNLSDPGVEDALYESAVLRHFSGVDLGRATAAADETTILRFRHLLEEHDLCGKMRKSSESYCRRHFRDCGWQSEMKGRASSVVGCGPQTTTMRFHD